jgi:hypothetical protein
MMKARLPFARYFLLAQFLLVAYRFYKRYQASRQQS